MSYTINPKCRLCDSEELTTVLDLGRTPLANELDGLDAFPLYVAHCEGCGHYQLPVVVDPERLFKNYTYVSNSNPKFLAHLTELAATLNKRLPNESYILEFGSNDGTLLTLLSFLGRKVLGVDPAENLALEANDNGIKTYAEFFNIKTAHHILKEEGRADAIIALNVFAHIADMKGAMQGIKHLLRPEGEFVFEVGYLPDVVANGLFDVIYHEHLDYHHLLPLERFFRRYGMWLVDAERVDSQGGSIRCTVTPKKRAMSWRLVELLVQEESLDFSILQDLINGTKHELGSLIRNLKASGKTIAGYGCPAKLTTLMYGLELDGDDFSCIYDDNPRKVWRRTPGKAIPILPSNTLVGDAPDYVMVFSWNFASEIIERVKKQGFKGTFIVPLPEVRLV